MKKNVRNPERIVRAILGSSIIGIGFAYESYWGIIGIVIMTPTFIAWHPLYAILEISTITNK